MGASLPASVLNYEISATSHSEELLAIRQILVEVGSYASSILDSKHQSLSRICSKMLKRVVGELSLRDCNPAPDEEVLDVSHDIAALSTLSVKELHSLYRQWPIRHKKRLRAGREHMTYYYEGKIVRELKSRKASSKIEQLMIDYCIATYNNELENLAFIVGCPVKKSKGIIYAESTKDYTPAELAELICRYSSYRDVAEREMLIEYVDCALGMIENIGFTDATKMLISALANLRQRQLIRVPEIVQNIG